MLGSESGSGWDERRLEKEEARCLAWVSWA